MKGDENMLNKRWLRAGMAWFIGWCSVLCPFRGATAEQAGSQNAAHSSTEAVAATAEKVLFDFEESEAKPGERVQGWARIWGPTHEGEASWNPLTFVYSDEHATHGKHSAYLETPRYNGADPAHKIFEYSTIGFKFKTPLDVSNYQFLTMDVFCPDTEDNSFLIMLQDERGKYTGSSGSFRVPPQSPMNIRMLISKLLQGADGSLNPNKISFIGFRRTSTERPSKLYVDNIKLMNFPPGSRQYRFTSVVAALQFGSKNGTVIKEGFDLVTTESMFAGESRLGWSAQYQLQTLDKPISDMVDPICSSAIYGMQAADFIVAARPGMYDLVVFSPCATDFSITINGTPMARIQTLEFYDYRKLRVANKDEKITLSLLPFDKAKWGIAAAVLLPVPHDEDIDTKLIDPLCKDILCAPWSVRAYLNEQRPTSISSAQKTLSPTSEEMKRGYALFMRPVGSEVSYFTQPEKDELLCRTSETPKGVELIVCKNEYRAMILCAHATRRVEIEGHLTKFSDDNGNEVAPENLSLKVAMPYFAPKSTGYEKRPDRLFSPDRIVDITTGETQPFWVIAQNVRPGTYRGNMVLKEFRIGHETTIPIVLHCRDVELKTPNMQWGVYFYCNYNKPENSDIQEECLKDMRNHNMTCIEIPLSMAISKEQTGEINYAGKGWLDAFCSSYRKYFAGPVILNCTPARIKLQQMVNAPLSSEKYIAEHAKFVKTLLTWRQEGQWPDLLYYDFDEMGWNSDSAGIYRATQAAGMKTYSTSCGVYGVKSTINAVDGIDWYVYPRWSIFDPVEQKKMMEAADMRKKMCFYEVNWSLASRWHWGIRAWASGYQGATIWHYNDGGNITSYLLSPSPVFYLGRGLRGGNSISSPGWECIREGINDHKVIFTLEGLIKQALAGNDARRRATALEFEKELSTLRSYALVNHNADDKLIVEWLSKNADALRDKFTAAIEQLSN